jgi:hypothetical protein
MACCKRAIAWSRRPSSASASAEWQSALAQHCGLSSLAVKRHRLFVRPAGFAAQALFLLKDTPIEVFKRSSRHRLSQLLVEKGGAEEAFRQGGAVSVIGRSAIHESLQMAAQIFVSAQQRLCLAAQFG